MVGSWRAQGQNRSCATASPGASSHRWLQTTAGKHPSLWDPGNPQVLLRWCRSSRNLPPVPNIPPLSRSKLVRGFCRPSSILPVAGYGPWEEEVVGWWLSWEPSVLLPQSRFTGVCLSAAPVALGCQVPQRDGHHACSVGQWHGDVGTLPALPSLLRCLGLDPPQSCPASMAEASSEGRAIFGAVTGSKWALAGVFVSLAIGRFFPHPQLKQLVNVDRS